MILNFLIFLIILGIVILVHEFGHFFAAKKLGMIVEEFGFGFPPRLASFKKRGTVYSLNLIPFGGFVKIKGETYEDVKTDAKNPNLFHNKPLWSRVTVVLAGIFMNFLLGWLILWIGFSFGFPSLTRDLSKIQGAQVIRQDVVVAQVEKNSPASQARIKEGDILVSAEGTEFKTVEDVQKFTKDLQGEETIFNIKDQKGSLKEVKVNLRDKTQAPLGVVIIPDNVVRFNVFQAAWEGILESYNIGKLTGQALIELLRNLFFHGKISEQITGPIGIYQATAQAAEVGFVAVVLLMVVITINLSLLNIVPFPALDGGKLAFLLVEAVFRKRIIALHIEQVIETVGFVLLILFIIAVTYKDIIRIG